MKAIIALEDGTWFEGRAFAGSGEIYGELVFNTAMTGYQEILTDPSYTGQIVTMCYPLIGNYGINPEDMESAKAGCAGLVIGEASRVTSNFRCGGSLKEYLEQQGLLGVDQVDTRAVTLHLRDSGAMRCVISTEESDPAVLVEKARNSEGLEGRDLASQVCCKEAYTWPGPHTSVQNFASLTTTGVQVYDGHLRPAVPADKPLRVAVLDCGCKFNQLRLLGQRGAELKVFPITSSAEDMLAWRPDGLFISNGPGDPAGVPYAADTVLTLIQSGLPTFGICFGHQLIGRALGGNTFKLKFGHHGANHPVMDLTTEKVEITSQNHGFCVDIESLGDEVETTHINLNDRTSEGLRHKKWPVFSVQYHPEAAPGPHDATYLFDRFFDLIREHKA